ncbi:MAG: glycoside hydrolase family 57 protein [Thermodesulfovibrionales bacterium]|nr:glycoside hydrolase family 57 protein [Thermodesulfovibrionales bacterium]
MKNSYPLYICILWHFHQPNYKDPHTGIYRLPWVRLHGTKDYLDMALRVQKFPSLKLNFNIVPSLIEQLNDYVHNGSKDIYQILTLKDSAELTDSEKVFILENFFLANWDNMIKPYPRYYELLKKRGFKFTRKDLTKIARNFSISELRDLQVLFNLCWIDPMFIQSDPYLSELAKKGRDFAEEDKKTIIDKQLEILKRIIPTYRVLFEQGQIEFSVSPFYHPILPLLCNTDIAKVAQPDIVLPKRRFSYPEDAKKQIKMSIDYFEDLFGRKPAGMWPSEGSVSEEVLGIIKSFGIDWVATDEEVLSRSLTLPFRDSQGSVFNPQLLYKLYNFNDVAIFFRDHILSDMIGFSYSGWGTQKAIDDFVNRLMHIRNSLPYDRPYLVAIIVDGENAWEYYPNDGSDFLNGIYNFLANDSRFQTITFSEFIKEHGKGEALSSLHPGSWINANFRIWIGHQEDNLAWEYLAKTREELSKYAIANPEKDLSAAWQALYIAEGSDWNWWYGDEHATETQEDFDELFRSHLIKVYEIIGIDIPPYLYVPIKIEARKIHPQIEPRGFIYPKIDGIMTSYFEWYLGAYIDVKRSGGSMHKSESMVSDIHYGFNKDNLFIRVDPFGSFGDIIENVIFHINILHPTLFKVVFLPKTSTQQATLYEKVDDKWIKVSDDLEAAIKDIFEIRIPFEQIKVKENDEIHFCVELIVNGRNGAIQTEQNSKRVEVIERCPWRGYISVTVPSPYFESIMWY